MSEELVVRQCSPTLAGIKTGSLFSCRIESKTELIEQIRKLNVSLSKKGVRIIPLRFRENTVLVYLFRPEMLRKDINNLSATELLKGLGYSEIKPESCIRHLIRRIRELDDFPHEIGLFLGYPPEDVRGFIEHNAKDEKLVGYWKVYGDADLARATFNKYRLCTEDYLRRIQTGNSIEKLTVKA